MTCFSTATLTDFCEIFNEFYARCAVAEGEPADEVCVLYKRNWSAHQLLTFHQEAQDQMQNVSESFWHEHKNQLAFE